MLSLTENMIETLPKMRNGATKSVMGDTLRHVGMSGKLRTFGCLAEQDVGKNIMRIGGIMVTRS